MLVSTLRGSRTISTSTVTPEDSGKVALKCLASNKFLLYAIHIHAGIKFFPLQAGLEESLLDESQMHQDYSWVLWCSHTTVCLLSYPVLQQAVASYVCDIKGNRQRIFYEVQLIYPIVKCKTFNTFLRLCWSERITHKKTHLHALSYIC